MTELPRRGGSTAVIAGFVAFLLAVGYLIASSVAKRTVEVYEPTPSGNAHPELVAGISDTVTIDAGDGKAWRFFDIDRGSLMTPPDTSGWDMAFRRFHIRAAGAMADAGQLAFADTPNPTLLKFETGSDGRDSSNAAIRRWYDYSMLTHLLEPNGHVFIVRTPEGRQAKLEVLSYYCRGLTPGCLTFRYEKLRDQ
ncbi:MAG: HmuY family protein [Anaerolineae bacterium]|nr:HmuY family protein [Gemmatimonadaceae bacterium]